MTLRHGSLCTGYGGIDLALEQVLDAETAWVSDIDKGACKVLARRYPDVPNLGDMTAVDWSTVEPVDVLSGGYPCQPFSHAGKRKGRDDERNLWPYVREAIRVLRPRLTVLENVAGHRSLGFDRVLGDLAEDGMHVRWTSLRASEVGAPHQRERLFIVVTPADASSYRWDQGRPESTGLVGRPDAALRSHADVALLPTPAAQEPGGTAERYHERLREHDGRDSSFLPLSMAVQLLPTPTTRDEAASGGSSPSDVTLTDAVVRTDLGTKTNPRHHQGGSDGHTQEARPGEVLPNLRSGAHEETVRERPARGSERVPQEASLLAELREYEGGCAGGYASMASPSGQAPEGMRGVRGDSSSARTPHRPERHEQRSKQPVGALPVVSPSPALEGRSRRTAGLDFGPYTEAVERWETVLGRPAPSPTEPGRNGRPRLSARFAEFLMGLPAGWITDVPGITRNEALRLCGNGVVPAQATAALNYLLTLETAA